MPFPTMPSAAAGAAQMLGPDHGVTQALAKAAITMAKADLWRARRLPRWRKGEAPVQ